MTQIWPGLGVAPVPTLVSVICKPDAVVMGFPAACAIAVVGEPTTNMPAVAVTRASATRAPARGKARILLLLGLIECGGLFSTSAGFMVIAAAAADRTRVIWQSPGPACCR